MVVLEIVHIGVVHVQYDSLAKACLLLRLGFFFLRTYIGRGEVLSRLGRLLPAQRQAHVGHAGTQRGQR